MLADFAISATPTLLMMPMPLFRHAPTPFDAAISPCWPFQASDADYFHSPRQPAINTFIFIAAIFTADYIDVRAISNFQPFTTISWLDAADKEMIRRQTRFITPLAEPTAADDNSHYAISHFIIRHYADYCHIDYAITVS